MSREIWGEALEQAMGATSGYFRPAFFSPSLSGSERNHRKKSQFLLVCDAVFLNNTRAKFHKADDLPTCIPLFGLVGMTYYNRHSESVKRMNILRGNALSTLRIWDCEPWFYQWLFIYKRYFSTLNLILFVHWVFFCCDWSFLSHRPRSVGCAKWGFAGYRWGWVVLGSCLRVRHQEHLWSVLLDS